MKLRPTSVLEGIEEVLRDRIAPLLSDHPFAANDIRMALSLLAIVRLGRDDEVALKVEENRLLRAIFADAAASLADTELAAGIADAAASHDPGITIGELDAETGRLRQLLVELHEHVDASQGEEARRISQAIWRALRDIEMPRAARA